MIQNNLEEARLRLLNGKCKHYCPDWDGLAIDEFCPEFECRTCNFYEEENNESKS